MVKIKGGSYVRPQLTEYMIVGRVPRTLGEITEIRNAGHRIVRVVLREDTHGNWWLVELRGPEVLESWHVSAHLSRRKEENRAVRASKSERVQRRAALVAKILRLKSALRKVR